MMMLSSSPPSDDDDQSSTTSSSYYWDYLVDSDNTKWIVTMVVTIGFTILYWKLYYSTNSNDTSEEVAARKERLLNSRLLHGQPLPNDLELTEETEQKQKQQQQQQQKRKNSTSSQTTTATTVPKNDQADESTEGSALVVTPKEEEEEGEGEASRRNKNIPAGTKIKERKTKEQQEEEQAPKSTPTTERTTTTTTSETKKKKKESSRRPFSSSRNSNNCNEHPGLEGFWHWWDVEMSLFRVYCRGRKDGEIAVPPYNPSSRRGLVPLALEVTNGFSSSSTSSSETNNLTAYWVDYNGNEINKGRFGPGQTWTQTTYIEHPWVFRDDDSQVILHYIPYRAIPTTPQEPTTDPSNPDVGRQRFTICDCSDNTHQCQVDDPVLPNPAKDFFVTTDIENAINWTLLHCYRMEYKSWKVIIQYLSKIVESPDQTKYRSIRISNPVFFQHVWTTPAKGLLLAIGFVETNDGYVELGTCDALPQVWVQKIEQLIYQLEEWERYTLSPQQPQGAADGYGRAGYGRAGTIN